MVYGLIVDLSGSDVITVPVVEDMNPVKYISFDESGAVYDRDKNNVRLNNCPPPFSIFERFKMSDGKEQSRVIALADLKHPIIIEKGLFEKYCYLLDGGVVISADDMRRVRIHPFPQQKDLEKMMSNADRAEDRFGCIGKNDDDFDIDYVY